MKKFSRILAVLLSVCLIAAFAVPMTFAEETDKVTFREDGSFKVMQIADIQDDQDLHELTVLLLKGAIEKENPDIIILTGDNIAGYRTKNATKSANAIRAFMSIIDTYGIPVVVTFGNHDAYQSGLTREEQMNVYYEFSCVKAVFNNGPEAGNSCVPVYSSTNPDEVKFLLWAFDTGANEGEDGSRVDNGGIGYDHIRQNQIDWFNETYAAYSAANGGATINSIIFQHIIVPQIFDALKETSSSTSGAVAKMGSYWVLPDTAAEGSVLGESPCPSANDGGEWDMAKANGGVLAITCGHDHNNSFIVPYEGIDIINAPGATFQSYANSDTKGVRCFVLNENDTTTYETYITLFTDCVELEGITAVKFQISSFIQNIYSFFNNLWQKVVSMFNLNDKVL